MNQPEDILSIGGLENLPDYTIFKKKTPSSKRYPSNSKRQLSRWYISFVKNNNPKIGYKYWISVNGYLDNKTLIQSSPVIDTESPLIILTENTKYYLVDKSDVLKFPPHSRFELKELTKFTNGFPQDWKNIIVAQLSEIFGSCRIKPSKLADNILSPFDKIFNEVFPEDNGLIEDNKALPQGNILEEPKNISISLNEVLIKNEEPNLGSKYSKSEGSENKFNVKSSDQNIVEEIEEFVPKKSRLSLDSKDTSDDIEIQSKAIKSSPSSKPLPVDIFLEDNINDFFNDKSNCKDIRKSNLSTPKREALAFPFELLDKPESNPVIIPSKNEKKPLISSSEFLEKTDIKPDNLTQSKKRESLGIPSELLNISDKLINAENNSFEKVMNLINSQKTNKKTPKNSPRMKGTKINNQSISEDLSFDILMKKTKEANKNESLIKKDSDKIQTILSSDKLQKFLSTEELQKSCSSESILKTSKSDELQKKVSENLEKSSSIEISDDLQSSTEEKSKTSSSSIEDHLKSNIYSNEDQREENSKTSSSSIEEQLKSSFSSPEDANIKQSYLKEEETKSIEDKAQIIRDRSEIIDFFLNSSFDIQDKNNLTSCEKLNGEMSLNIKTNQKNGADDLIDNENAKGVESIFNMGNVLDKTHENSTFNPNDTDKINLSLINKRNNFTNQAIRTNKKKNSLDALVKSSNSFLSCDRTASQKDNSGNKSMLETIMNSGVSRPYSYDEVKIKNKSETSSKKKKNNSIVEEDTDAVDSIKLIEEAPKSIEKDSEFIEDDSRINKRSVSPNTSLAAANQTLSKEIEDIKKKFFEEGDIVHESSTDNIKFSSENSQIKTPKQSKGRKKKKGRTSLCMPKKKPSGKSKADETE